MKRALAFLVGALLLLFGLTQLLKPRARYVSAHPGPGATLAAPPPAVTVRFSDELDSTSTLSVSYQGENVTTTSGLDPGDPQQRSLRAVLRWGLPAGVYRVSWRAVAMRGKAVRHGEFSFGAGVPVSEHTGRPGLGEAGEPGGLRERDFQRRRRNRVVLGAALFILLGAFAHRLPRRR